MNREYLETSLFPLPPQDDGLQHSWKVRNAVEGVQIFGGIGSGKTSGSGRTLALKYLKAGFGGLVLTVKPDEVDLWREYCQLTGRSDDLVVIEPGGQERFNFLEYESAISTSAVTQNVHQLLKTVINAGKDKAGGSNNDPFWEDALDLVLLHLIELCLLAHERVTISDLNDIAQHLPQKQVGQVTSQLDKLNKAKPLNDYDRALDAIMAKAEKEEQYQRAVKMVKEFFESKYSVLADRTRSIIDFTFLSFMSRLMREPVFSLFCTGNSTITPDDCRKGKIILLNLPVKQYDKVGRDCQIMFKYIWQRAMERTLANNEHSRVVFLWADEAQNFIHEHDADFQATARSSQVATVYLTQNLPNYYANMGGAKYRYKTQSFLGTLATKFFHANADTETNEYASKLIGKTDRVKKSQGFTDSMGDDSENTTISVERDELVRPEQFTRLENGGAANNKMVEAYIHFQGNVLGGQVSHTLLTFNQDFLP
ncbi:MAG: type IV secretory system conjugative DNA transfer family protein [Bacteroidia bacterium]|jgi:type IV secretory pathway TraG/TraD family ATPase VirD4|nr:type IV secretory system conjugative DNA transfer family protein [Bacteroidia bacterium]